MGEQASTVKECVEENSEKDTVDYTAKPVSKKTSRKSRTTSYRVSSNFD